MIINNHLWLLITIDNPYPPLYFRMRIAINVALLGLSPTCSILQSHPRGSESDPWGMLTFMTLGSKQFLWIFSMGIPGSLACCLVANYPRIVIGWKKNLVISQWDFCGSKSSTYISLGWTVPHLNDSWVVNHQVHHLDPAILLGGPKKT